MKKISSALVLALLLSIFAPLSVFAASETKIETKGGIVTLSNIVKEVELIKDNPEGSDTAYISEGAVTLKIVSDDDVDDNDWRASVEYHANAEIKDGSFISSGKSADIYLMKNSVTFSEPGYYSGYIYFSDFRLSRATFVIQVGNSESSSDTASAGDNGSDSPAIPVTENVSAKSTSSKVMVNGNEVSFQAYNINNNNYFKLRDLAMVLNGTEKSFAVGWNGEKNAISLESGKTYKIVGGELVVAEKSASEKARFSSSAIYLDGKKVELTAYLINGNNYFKLRDVAAALDFGVTWDASSNSIVIDTSSGYVPEG